MLKVSVCITAFNIEQYIEKALDSVLSQKTDFDYEIVIGEDKSTDTTLSILKSYQNRYPDKIRVIENELNRGFMTNYISTIMACKGEYVAMLDGDDYWIDENKLQKQVLFMDSNLNYSLCWHDAAIIPDGPGKNWSYAERFSGRNYDQLIDMDMVIRWKVLGATSSMFFRNNLFKFPGWGHDRALGGPEFLLCYLTLQQGQLKYMHDRMSVYRIRPNSLETSIGKIKKAERNIKESEIMLSVQNKIYRTMYTGKIAWNHFYLTYIFLTKANIFRALTHSLYFLFVLPKWLFYKISDRF